MFLFYFIAAVHVYVTVPKKPSSIGLSQQLITKSETENRPNVEQPSQQGEGNTPVSTREDQSAGENKQQKDPTVHEVRRGIL